MSETPYERIGRGYARSRGEDARVRDALHRALGDARSVLNVGAGSGSYEPRDRRVIALEPSLRMLRQRAPDAAFALCGEAEALPLRDAAVDAALGVLTLHHWRDLERAGAELRRVARRRVVFLTFDPQVRTFWLTSDYFPEFSAEDAERFPAIAAYGELFRGSARAEPLWIPDDCQDGFLCAFWNRPRAYLDPEVRRAISSFASRSDEELAPGLARLTADLESGRWDEVHGAALAEREAMDFGYRIVTIEF